MPVPHSRREFLYGLSASAAALAPGPPDEAYWGAIRAQFAFDEACVPMNAANLCPSPRAVAERVTELTRDIDRDCSFQNRAKFSKLLEEARAKVAAHLGVSAGEIALVRNTSEANNTINNGLPLKHGDEVVLWDQNHPTNNVAWDVRAARAGLVVRRVSVPRQPREAGELVAVFERAFSPRTRVLAITHVSNVSGVRLPVRELCDAAHRRSIFVHVDGAQSWGALAVDLRALDCDSYSGSAHKWFMGPKEAGVLYVRAERIAGIWPNTVGADWGKDAETKLKGARKFESLGQRDDACLAAVATTADFHHRIGPERIEARVLELATRLKDGLAETGARLVTPREKSLSAGVCIIEAPDGRAPVVFEELYRQYGIAGAPTGGLRLSPHIYNTPAHVARAIRGVNALLGKIV
ncbi:MAG: aminotransferase class V-fold PLP-dependent enzyme [Bryobacteraceae bacterium]